MIRYRLVDINGEHRDIDDSTLRRTEDTSTIEVDIIEKSFKGGAVFPGVQRDESKEIQFIFVENNQDEQLYRNYENNLRLWLRKTRWIQDLINNIETEVLFKENVIAYVDGGQHLSSDNTITFVQLNPYWQDIDYQIEQESGISSGELVINNNGYLETAPIIELEALEPCSKFAIKVRETGKGIIIQDFSFGVNGQNTYIIDNSEGSAELNQVDRNNKIQLNTGFISLPVGINNLEFTFNGSCTVLVKWKRRYYL